jgi:hypothetical protein
MKRTDVKMGLIKHSLLQFQSHLHTALRVFVNDAHVTAVTVTIQPYVQRESTRIKFMLKNTFQSRI